MWGTGNRNSPVNPALLVPCTSEELGAPVTGVVERQRAVNLHTTLHTYTVS